MTDDVKRGFKRKTIIRTIKHKMSLWLKSLPEELSKRVESKYFVRWN